MMERLTITTFGELRFQVGDEIISGFNSRKAEALLVYLAVEKNSVHRRESLFTLMWPEMMEISARNNLRQVLFSLRRAMPEVASLENEKESVPLLLADRQTVQINPAAAVEVDIHQIDRLLDEIKVHDHLNLAGCQVCGESLEKVVALYQGNFLADFYLEDSAEFEEWAEANREDYRSKILNTLEGLTEINIQQGNYDQARGYAEEQLKVDPLREIAYRQLMELYSKSGQRTEALRTYQRCTRILKLELGTNPSRETTGLYEIISGEDLQKTTATPREGMIRGYQIREHLGSGHTGMVYRAFQPVINRDVAIKVIAPQFANYPDFIRRFEVEAQLIARLEHPYIVPLYDYWRDPSGAYLVMRWLKGGSLQDYLKTGPWMPEAAVGLIDQISAALFFAHRQGVVHCDIKPANILLDEEKSAYLTDFGIAILTGPLAQLSQHTDLGGDGSSSGSLGYSSPEVARGQQNTILADVYSLGVVLFELLTARHPFLGLEGEALIQKHLREPLPSVRIYRAELPEAVDAVIQKATDKEPAQRYQEVDQLAKAFRQAIYPEAITIQETTTLNQEVRNPYKGLRSFEEVDSPDFFGRDQLVQRFLARLAPRDFDTGERFLVVVGPSGSGKSSVIKAGLIRALRKGAIPGSEDWFIVEMTPGKHPLEELETALLRIAIKTPEDLLVQLQADAHSLVRVLRQSLPGVEDEILLVIDQFEELYTLVEDENERKYFIMLLTEAIQDPHSPLRVVITLRADFYDRPLQHSQFGELVREAVEVVLPLNADEMERAICGPAEVVGIRMEPALVARIVQEVGDQPGTLPLLQYALTESFERREENLMTLAAYQVSGGVLGALGRRAEEIYTGLDKAEQEMTRQLFLRLVTLGEGSEDTRRRVQLSEIEALLGHSSVTFNPVIEQYGRYRLLTFDHDPATRTPTLDVAHEALLREWPRLRGWLDESRDDIRMQRLLAVAAGEWQANGRETSYLLRGTRLNQFTLWVDEADIALTEDEDEYLKASLVERQVRKAAEAQRQAHEERLEQRFSRFLRALVVVLAVATVIAVILSMVAFNQGNIAQQNAATATYAQGEALQLAAAEATSAADAREQQAIAEEQSAARATQQAIAEEQTIIAQEQELAALLQASVGLASQAELQMAGINPERAVLLALEAVENYPYTWQAERALGEAVLNHKLLLDLYQGGFVGSARISPDGKRIVTAGDGKAIVWDSQTGEIMLKLDIQGNSSAQALWSPEGDRILTFGNSTVAEIWDASTGALLHAFSDYGGYYADWSPDGNRIHTSYSFSQDSLMIWDANTGEPLSSLPGGVGLVKFGRWSPDGKNILASTGQVWNVETGEKLFTLSGYEEQIDSRLQILAFYSPDGSYLAGGFQGGGPGRIWDAATGEEILKLPGHSGRVITEWSPTGDRLITFGLDDGTAKIWDLESGEEIHTLVGNWPGAWSPDGTHILLTGENGQIKVWDAATGIVLLTIQANMYLGGGRTLEWFPSGDRILAVSKSNSVKVWDVSEAIFPFSCQPDCPFSYYGGWTSGVDWSPDGDKIARGFMDGTIKVWDISSGEERISMKFQPIVDDDFLNSGVQAVAWSPDGDRLLTTGNDGAARIWDVTTGEELLLLPGVEANFSGELDSYAAWSPDGGRILTVSSRDELARVWDAVSGEILLTFSEHSPFTGAWSPDGTRIVTTENNSEAGSTKVWNADTGEVLLDLFPADFAFAVSAVAWSPDGTKIITFSGDGLGRLWDADTGEELLVFAGLTSVVGPHIEWSPSGSRVLTGGNGGDVKVWDMRTGNELLNFPIPGDSASASWSPDGKFIAISDWAGNLRIYRTWQSIQELVDYAKACCTIRKLTPEERERFGLPEKP